MIVAALLARNRSSTIGFAVRSVFWCDSVFLLDDHSSDNTADVAKSAAAVPMHVEHSPFSRPAFDEGEVLIRNYLLDRVERTLSPDAILLLDADELMDESLQPFARDVERDRYSSISCSIFHLYDGLRYIRYRETIKYGLYQIDPHVRVIRAAMRYVELRPGQLGHPLMCPGDRPLHLHGPFHFHLKYLRALDLPNTSIEFLPNRFTEDVVKNYLSAIDFRLPSQVEHTLRTMGYDARPGDDRRDLPTRAATFAAGTGASCLLVTVGVPAEAIILDRIVARLASQPWTQVLRVVCSPAIGAVAPPAEQWTLEELTVAHQRGAHFDLTLQLSRDPFAAAIASKVDATVRRGLTVSAAGHLSAVNILALGYERALREGADPQHLAQLAAQACELE